MPAKLLSCGNFLAPFVVAVVLGSCAHSADERPGSGEQGSGVPPGSPSSTSTGNGFVPPPASSPGGGDGETLVVTPPPAGQAPACQSAQVVFEPKIPTVFVLVDRSGSMFRAEPKPWEPLKAAVLDTIQSLQAEIRFGFGAFTGEVNDCPMFDSVNADFNNHAAIQGLYDSLKEPAKGETPTMLVLSQVRDLLTADLTDGPKYVLFVTDGDPDYCGDGNALCPIDGVVYRLQQLAAAGIKTFVFGLQTTQSDIPLSTLQAFANAGAGEPVGYLERQGRVVMPVNIYDECSPGGDPNAAGWRADYLAAGHTIAPGARTETTPALGVYSAVGGTATVFQPDPAKQAELAAQVRSVVSNTKSCTFDLQGQIKVDLARANQGRVVIDGAPVPYEPASGWRMLTETELELVGSACQSWRNTGKVIDFDFPCEIIIPR